MAPALLGAGAAKKEAGMVGLFGDGLTLMTGIGTAAALMTSVLMKEVGSAEVK